MTLGNGKWENGKDVSASHSLSHSYSFSYSLSFQFHLPLAFILDLHLIWLSPPLCYCSPPRLVSRFVYFQLQPRFYARQGKRHTNIYAKMAKTMRMPRPNSTAHLQMNRLMSAGCGVRDTPPATPTTPLSIPPCSFLPLFMRQSSGSAQIDFKHVNLNLLLPWCHRGEGGVAAVEIVAQPLAGIQFELELCLRLISATQRALFVSICFLGYKYYSYAALHAAIEATKWQFHNKLTAQPGS